MGKLSEEEGDWEVPEAPPPPSPPPKPIAAKKKGKQF